MKDRHSATLQEAQWMIELGGLSQSAYQEFRLRFIDRFVFPTVNHVAAENQLHRPVLKEYHHGVLGPIMQCLSLTLSERIQYLDLSNLGPDVNISFELNWGPDGSGEHSNPHQISKVHFTTKQVVLCCFSIKEVKVSDQSGNEVKWRSSDSGANKPQNVRPLAVFPAKEEDSLLKEFIPMVESEIEEVKENGVLVKCGGSEEIVANCTCASLSMVDGKMITRLLQLGGAYCTMCTKSLVECHNPDIIKAGLSIDRNVESITDLALSLSDPDTGEVRTRKRDYKVRQGVTAIPITSSDVTKNIPVCHSKIRTTQWFVELLYRLVSHKKWYAPERPVTYSEDEKTDYLIAQGYVNDELYSKLGINMGNPGDMIGGNAFKAFSSDSARKVICSIVDDNVKEAISEIHLGLCAVVKVLNSQKRKVNVQALRELSTSVLLCIVENFPWVVISQSVHRILSHGAERIEMNGGFGLGDMSEEGSEALNKFVRKADYSGSRADSTLHRFTDIFNHLWDRSRPVINGETNSQKERESYHCHRNRIFSHKSVLGR